MYKFFKHCKMHNAENISEERISAIKSSVLSQVNQSEEDIPMKQHFSVKPLLIAAAVSATAVASIATANAATDGAVMDGISKTFTFMLNGREVEGEITSYTIGSGDEVKSIEITVPDADLIDGDEFAIMIGEDGKITQIGGTTGENKYFEIDENGKATEVEAPVDISGLTAGEAVYYEIDENGNATQVSAPTE